MKEFVLGEKSELTLVADAVRAKTGKNNTLNLSEMITEIENIELGRNEEEILKEWIEDLGSGNYSNYTNSLCSSIGKGVFAETEIRSAIFPNCKTINTKAFKNCTKLSYFQGDNVNYIYDEAFNGCNKLSEARLYNIFEIGNSAFYNCGNLTSIGGTDQLYMVGNEAFAYCQKLDTIYIQNIYDIGDSAFYYCTNLFFYPNGVDGQINTIGKNAFANCYGLSNVNIDNGSYYDEIVGIGSSAFYYCTGLRSVEINGMHYINDNAFKYCNSLNYLSIKNVNTIGSSAFANCTMLTSAYFKNVNNLGFYAFENCPNLSEITLDGPYICEGASGIFNNSTNIRHIYVHGPLVNIYRNVWGWADYGYYIYPIGYEGNGSGSGSSPTAEWDNKLVVSEYEENTQEFTAIFTSEMVDYDITWEEYTYSENNTAGFFCEIYEDSSELYTPNYHSILKWSEEDKTFNQVYPFDTIDFSAYYVAFYYEEILEE